MVLAIALVLYGVTRTAVLAIAETTPTNCLWLDVIACIAASAMREVRYGEVAVPLRILARGIGATVLVQLAFDASTLFYDQISQLSEADGAFFRVGTGVGLAAGAIGLWRPAFLLPLLFHYIAFRHQYGLVTGIIISSTDYLSMAEIGEFAAIGALLTAVFPRSGSEDRLGNGLRPRAADLIWACAVGAHLGNYLISAWTKIRVGGDDPLLWLLHNPTQTSIVIGLERGDNPLAAWPWLVQASWDGIVAGGVWLNLFVLGLQLAAPLAAVHRRALMVATLLFDLFHVGVYLTLGALFLFWIIVNLLVYASAQRMSDAAMTPAVKLTMAGAVFAGHLLFYTSHLGWLDGAKLASPSVVAETADGRRVPVPSVFFGMHSYTIAQTLTYVPDGQFPTRIGGNSYSNAEWQDSKACGAATRLPDTDAENWRAVETMVRETDAAIRAHPIVKQMNLFYLYPHHMVANPWVFRSFNSLSMDEIVRYHYVVESVCLTLRDGHLARDVRMMTDHPIDVRY